jgi:hypothetical protein
MKKDLFKIEELEPRLEIAAWEEDNSSCSNDGCSNSTCTDESCTSNAGCEPKKVE